MSDSDDENYVTFGVPLDPLDEENLPRKKAVTIEDQYALDQQGRRRFHGAFTGGFSAGYFNTVGTRDGWKPQQFKSSRSSKAGNVMQRPEDFMDEEDTSEFGIAPQGIRATCDYTDHGQRGAKRERNHRDNDGPIPGTPVLKELLKPVRETVGITLLKKMGWRPGQGIGSRQTKKEKAKMKQRNAKIQASQYVIQGNAAGSSSEESEDESISLTFAPDDYEPFRCNPKDNFFGIGYSGLERRNVLSSHINLFDVPAFSMQEKNKKLSIHGQAFGVGAFEADDEDIYAREDMSHYDFALGPERKTKSRWSDAGTSKNLGVDCLEGFVRARNSLPNRKLFPLPELPKGYIPVHVVRKSRFYPPIENVTRTLQNGKRKDLTAVDRARILDDGDRTSTPLISQPNTVPSVASQIVTRTLNLHGKQQIEERKKLENQATKLATSWMDKLNAHSFVKAGIVGQSNNNSEKLSEQNESPTVSDTVVTTENMNDKTVFKPFIADPDKQRRFEHFLDLSKKNEKHKFESFQPLSMTEWDREHERTEFEQAARLFESSKHHIISNPESSNISTAPPTKLSPQDEMKEAVKMKMFGKLTRERMEWKPASIVCKRFNIPEPKVGCAQPELQKKVTKYSIFDSLDWNSSSKFLKAIDTAPEQANEVSFLTNESPRENLVPSSNSDNKNFTEPLQEKNQTDEPVSEKVRNFEACYEKVFGRGVEEVLSTRIIEPNTNPTKVQETKVDLEPEGQLKSNIFVNEQENNLSTLASKNKCEEKKDLFKAIFLSSSEESDSEPEQSVDSEALKSVLIGKVSSNINTQRNASPPRGIFAKVDLDNLVISSKRDETHVANTTEKTQAAVQSTQCETHSDTNEEITSISVQPDMYGPALPARLIKPENNPALEESPSQNLKPVFRSVVVPKTSNSSNISGKWVEASKLKKSKKEKKKHKHKEHKSSKHKRKLKKEKR